MLPFSVRRRVLRALLLACALLAALPFTATAATQTTTDPDDPYEDGYALASDLQKLTWDSTSTPGKLVLDLSIDYAPNSRFGAYVLLDTNRDDKTDYALDITDYDYAQNGYTDQEPSHHGAFNENGHVRYTLRRVTSSTVDCQAFDDGGLQGPEIWAYEHATAQTVDHDTSRIVLPLDLATLGNPTALRWAVVSTAAKPPYDLFKSYDFFPDGTNGMTDDDGFPRDPRGPYIEADPAYCSPGDGPAYGRRVRMAQGVLFSLAGVAPPAITVTQQPASARPGSTVAFTAAPTDGRAISSYAWDLDEDGEFDDATGPTASRHFPSGGRRFVRVKAMDSNGLTGTGEKTVDIVDLAPTVSIGQSPALARPNRAVTLDATGTDDGTITAYAWDLDGDGDFDDATGARATATFPTTGTKTVKVRVSDDGGNATTAERTIEVAERAPTIKLTVDKASPAAKEKFTIHADVTDDGTIADKDIQWGFDADNAGDDDDPYTWATGRDWTLSFGWAGRYTMKARVTDDTGQVATDRITVEVPNARPTIRQVLIRKKLVPDNPYNAQPLVKEEPILLTVGVQDDNRTLPVATWDLDNDGEFDDATGLTVEHKFKFAGETNVGVRLTDELGLTSESRTPVEIRESATAECSGSVKVDLLRVVGCFRTEADGQRSTKEEIKVNGTSIVPKPYTTIKVNPKTGAITSGDGVVTIKAGDVTLFEGRIKMDEDCDRTKKECSLFKAKVIPGLSKVKGLPLAGEFEVFLTPTGTRIQVNVDVFGSVGIGATGRMDLLVLDKGGLQLDDLEIRVGVLPLVKNFEIGSFFLKYEKENKRWSGGGYIVIPTPQFTKLQGDFAFSEITGFERAHGEIDGLNIPVDPLATIYLQRIAFTFELKGSGVTTRVRLGGGLGASFGPRIGGMDAGTVDGDFLLTLGWPLGIDVEGRASIMGYDILGASVGMRTNGSIDASGFIGFGLPFPRGAQGARKDGTKIKVSKFDPNADIFNPFQIITVKGTMSAWAEPTGFNIEAGVSAKVIGITLVGAKALLSSKGIAGCGEIIGIKGGFGYEWQSQRTDLFGASCDLSPWRPERHFAPLDGPGAGRVPMQARAHAAQAPEAGNVVDVPLQQKALMLKADGVGGDPVLALVSPSGKRYAMPAGGAGAAEHEDWFYATNPQGDETYLGVRTPEAGAWQVETVPGSPAIKSLSRSAVLPQPEVSATVRPGGGRTRTIDYRVKTIPGQTVEFAEDGKDTHRTVGVAKGARGSLTFTPQDGSAGTRKLVAVVKQNGLIRANIPVGQFTAPALARPSQPRALRAARGSKGTVTVRWKKVPGAVTYQVLAKLSDGQGLYVSTTKPVAVVRGVQRADAAKITVAAVDAKMRGSKRGVVRLARNQRSAPRRPLATTRRAAPRGPRFTG